mmetsp:Transcript_7515/g.15578  ORF Transcript_7515/g.15578 Transcript_7515/m.15578 type:complete len:511 (+) Transcript_7515:73-1605(+)
MVITASITELNQGEMSGDAICESHVHTGASLNNYENMEEELSSRRGAKDEEGVADGDLIAGGRTFLGKITNLAKTRCSVALNKKKSRQRGTDSTERRPVGGAPRLRIKLPMASPRPPRLRLRSPPPPGGISGGISAGIAGCTDSPPLDFLRVLSPSRGVPVPEAVVSTVPHHGMPASGFSRGTFGLEKPSPRADQYLDKENAPFADSNVAWGPSPLLPPPISPRPSSNRAPSQCTDYDMMDEDAVCEELSVSPREIYGARTSPACSSISTSSDGEIMISPLSFSTDRHTNKSIDENITPPNRSTVSDTFSTSGAPPPHSAECARYYWQMCYNTQYPNTNHIYKVPHTQPIKSCLSSRKKPRYLTFDLASSTVETPKAVRFGQSCAAEFSHEQPPSKLTPLPAEAAKTRFPVEEKSESPEEIILHRATAKNTALLASWDNNFFGRPSDGEFVARKKKRSKGAEGSRSKRRGSDIFGISGRSLIEDDNFDVCRERGNGECSEAYKEGSPMED